MTLVFHGPPCAQHSGRPVALRCSLEEQEAGQSSTNRGQKSHWVRPSPGLSNGGRDLFQAAWQVAFGMFTCRSSCLAIYRALVCQFLRNLSLGNNNGILFFLLFHMYLLIDLLR